MTLEEMGAHGESATTTLEETEARDEDDNG